SSVVAHARWRGREDQATGVFDGWRSGFAGFGVGRGKEEGRREKGEGRREKGEGRTGFPSISSPVNPVDSSSQILGGRRLPQTKKAGWGASRTPTCSCKDFNRYRLLPAPPRSDFRLNRPRPSVRWK